MASAGAQPSNNHPPVNFRLRASRDRVSAHYSDHAQLEPHHVNPPPKQPLRLEWMRLNAASARASAKASSTIRREQGWLAATVDLTVRSVRLTSDLLAARLGALHAMGLLALVFLTHRLARLLDTTARLIITPCGGSVGCVRVLGLCARAMLSLALLTGPLVLLLELMTRLGIINSDDVSYRVPLPVFPVDLPTNEYNTTLPDAVLDLTYLAITNGLLFLSLLLLAVCGVGRPPHSHVHMYSTAERRRVEEVERLLSGDAVLAQSEAIKGERKRLLHLAIPHSASRPLDRPSLNRLRARRPVSTLDYFNSQMLSMMSSPSHGHAYQAAQLEAAMAERSRQVTGDG